MEFLRRLGFGVSAGILLGVAWPMGPLFPLIFIGFIPLLLLERRITKMNPEKSGRQVLLHTFISFVIWNLITTWWVWNSSPGGFVAAFLANSFLQALPFLAFHHTRKWMGDKLGYISLVVYWIAFEYLHLSWEFTWPWLTLGNVFATAPNIVQWYEYTGALGGSLWVLLGNIAILFMLYSRFKIKDLVITIAVLGIPVLGSWMISVEKPKGMEDFEVLVIQPNVDCFTEKFKYDERTGEKNANYIRPPEQAKRLQMLTNEYATNETDIVLWPETAIPNVLFWEHRLDQMKGYIPAFKQQSVDGDFSILAGITTYAQYQPTAKFIPPSARESRQGYYYTIFNAAIYMDGTDSVEIYRKSKLVPGVERMPYPGILPLEYLAINLGGVSGTLGIQRERDVFTSNKTGLKSAPVICYESVFGGFVTNYFDKGADYIAIITNDGWWGNTSGHKQHFEYARLRAIENRTWVARSANTGISGFIAPDGKVVSTLGWDKQGALKCKITKRWKKTFYTEYGDYIGRILAFLAVLFLISLFGKRMRGKGQLTRTTAKPI